MTDNKKPTEEELAAVRRYRDIISKKAYTNADINFLLEVNQDLN